MAFQEDLKSKSNEALQVQLPFQIFLLVAKADSKVDQEEFQAFFDSLNAQDLCRNPYTLGIFRKAAVNYTYLSRQFAEGRLTFSLEQIQKTLHHISDHLPNKDVKEFHSDLLRLADGIAKASRENLLERHIGAEEQKILNQLKDISKVYLSKRLAEEHPTTISQEAASSPSTAIPRSNKPPRCPVCIAEHLSIAMTKQGVEIDICESCGGIWLDKGEIFHFTKKPKRLVKVLQEGKKTAQNTFRLNPKIRKPMQQLTLLGGDLTIEVCPETHGIWLDAGELEKLLTIDSKTLNIQIDKRVKQAPQKKEAQKQKTTKKRKLKFQRLPNLTFRAFVTIAILYSFPLIAMLALSHFAPGESSKVQLPIAEVFLTTTFFFLISPWLTDWSMRWFYRLQWTPVEKLPHDLHLFIENICQAQKIKIPKFGIMDDPTPNAFTYGHSPRNARIVLTQGLLNVLDPQEIEAVIAHEMGHIKHWDMLWMSIVQVVPLFLGHLYHKILDRLHETSDEKTQEGLGYAAVVTYFLYTISQYLVLSFSRIREYHADRFAAYATGDPNTLIRALFKIGYGMAGKDLEEEDTQRSHTIKDIQAFGIFDSESSHAFSISGFSQGSHLDALSIGKESFKAAMMWDLWNPWAKYYELSSTHPLVAKRVGYLINQAQVMGISPLLALPTQKPESYWDEFLIDVVVQHLPMVSLVGFTLTAMLIPHYFLMFPIGLLFSGFFLLLRLRFSYPGGPLPDMSISALLKKIKVSGIRSVPCKIKGRVVGKGVPGLIWSDDFVVEDETGIMFLDYGIISRVLEFLFAATRGESLQDEMVEVEGWYRRCPTPYIEVKSIRTSHNTHSSYVPFFRYLFAIILIVLGLFLLPTMEQAHWDAINVFL